MERLNLMNLLKKVYVMQTADTRDLDLKNVYNTKINEIVQKITDPDHDKNITTQEFNKLTSAKFWCKINKSKYSKQNDIADFIKKTDFDGRAKEI